MRQLNNLTYYICGLLFCCCFPLLGQEQQKSDTHTASSSFMLSLGKSHLLDTYLTQSNYEGLHLSLLHEFMNFTDKHTQKWAYQCLSGVEFSTTQTIFQQGRYWQGAIDFNATTYRLFSPARNLHIGVGPSLGMEAGFIYNLRGGNNPATAKLSVHAGAGAMISYQCLKWKKLPLYFRYQAIVPAVSAFFSPHFGQSYYEIFTLGNRKGTCIIGSFHNRFDLDQLFTVDMSLGRGYLRLGYSGKMHLTNVHHIKTRIISHSFLIGYTREFIPFYRRNAADPERRSNPIF